MVVGSGGCGVGDSCETSGGNDKDYSSKYTAIISGFAFRMSVLVGYLKPKHFQQLCILIFTSLRKILNQMSLDGKIEQF